MRGALLCRSRLSVCVLAMLILPGLAAAAHGSPEKSKVDAFEKQLAKKGFTWQAGLAWWPPILDMCCQCQLPSCYANNASTKYGFFALPPAPGQSASVKNPYAEWFTEDQELPADWSYAWRLRPDEAVVFIAKTPPKVEYFGFTAYLYDRYVAGMGPDPDCTYTDDQGAVQHRAQPPSVQSRFPVFASLGDTLNEQTIDLAGGRENPYQKNVVVVAATDQKVLHQVQNALTAAGYPEKSINVLIFPQALLRLGTDSQSDSAMVLFRVSEGDNDISYYYSQPMTVLRVSPSTPIPSPQLDPIAPPKLRIRGTGKTEAYLESQVDALGQAVVAYYAGMGYKASPVKVSTLPDGLNCITNMQNCLADNRDTIYISPAYDIMSSDLLPEQPSLVLGPNDFLVAYGVQHPSVKKALYSNISVMGWVKRAAPAVVTNEEMAGSAQEYLPGADPALYAYQIARTCIAQHCVPIAYDCTGGIAADEPVMPVFRAYLEPGTKIGPSRGEVILDRMFKFSPASSLPTGN